MVDRGQRGERFTVNMKHRFAAPGYRGRVIGETQPVRCGIDRNRVGAAAQRDSILPGR